MPVHVQAYLYQSLLFRKSSCEQNTSVLLEINLKSHLILGKLRPEWEGASQGYMVWGLETCLAGTGSGPDHRGSKRPQNMPTHPPRGGLPFLGPSSPEAELSRNRQLQPHHQLAQWRISDSWASRHSLSEEGGICRPFSCPHCTKPSRGHLPLSSGAWFLLQATYNLSYN